MTTSVKADIDKEIKAEELKEILEKQAKQANPVHEILEETRSDLDEIKQQATRDIEAGRDALDKADADADILEAFDAPWSTYVPHMSAFVVIAVSAAEMIYSPAYDLGFTEDELRQTNLAKLNAL